MVELSDRVQELAGQPMFTLLAKAQEREKAGEKMYHFEIGDPDFNSPAVASAIVQNELDYGRTHYAPSRGIDELLDASADVTERSRGFRPGHEQLLVTPGANIQIYLAMACVADAEWYDGVIIPCPYFPSYVSQARSLGLYPNIVPVDPKTNKVNIHSLQEAFRSRLFDYKAIILNSPNNPTGAVYAPDEIRAIYEVAENNDVLIISDEVYARTIFDGEFFSPSMIDQCKKRVVVVNGFSKSHAMAGWRLGVATGPEHIIEKMRILQETILSCVPPFIQKAGAAVLRSDQAEARWFSDRLHMRRDAMVSALKMVTDLSFVIPDGGLYIWAKIENGMTSEEYCNMALEKGVVVSPGTMFGVEGYVRFAYVRNTYDIQEGIGRLAK